jgi:hypothetical protein
MLRQIQFKFFQESEVYVMAVEVTSKSNLLSRTLQGNSIFSGLSGIVFIVAAGPLAAFLGLDAPLVLMIIGVSLLLYAVGLFQTATRKPISRSLALTAIILDVAWVAGSWLLLLTGWLPLTTEGKWAVAIVAEIVSVFAILQYIGLRRMVN